MKTVLVVEDSNTSRDITSHFLQQGGFRVLEACDGADALNILKSRHVDLILTDVMMPNMDGWGLYREVRSDKRYNLTPCVFLTVLDELDDQIKGLTMGVDDYITKPVTPQQLIARVNTALMRSERLANYFHRNPVTDLVTPRYFKERIVQEAARSKASGHDLSLVVFGIGNYVALVRAHAEWFAESAAHLSGKALMKQLRSFDVIADMGHGRFGVLLPNMQLDEVQVWAEGIAKSWKVSLVWPETQQNESVDIGYECASLTGVDDALAILDKHLASFDRKW